MKLNRATLLSLLFFISTPALAHQVINPCEAALHADVNLDQIFSLKAANWREGLGNRAFLGNEPAYSPESSTVAFRHGLLWWGMRSFIVPSMDEAIAHRTHPDYIDPMKTGFYFIGDEHAVTQTTAQENHITLSPEAYDRLLNLDAYQLDVEWGEEVGADGQKRSVAKSVTPVRVERAMLEKYLSRTDLLLNKDSAANYSHGRNYIGQEGWVALKERGVVDFKDWSRRASYKSALAFAKARIAEGYTVKFNHDFAAAVEATRVQPRIKEGQVLSAKKNRYVQHPHLLEVALARNASGNGLSVEVYDPQGRLVGGEFGFIEGNRYFGESIFYDPYDHYKDDPEIKRAGGVIMFAKMALVALGQEFAKKGMNYSDAGIVSSYTTTVGGRYVPHDQFLDMMASGPREKIKLPTQWDAHAYPPGNTEEIFNGYLKARDHGLSDRAFMGRYPDRTAESAKTALRMGVMPWNLWIYVMPSFEAAREHAQQAWWNQIWDAEKQEYKKDKDGNVIVKGKRDRLMSGIYLIGDPASPPVKGAFAVDTLDKLIDGGAVFFPDPYDTKKVKRYTPAELRSRIVPTFKPQEILWVQSVQNAGLGIVVPGYTIPKIHGMLKTDILDGRIYREIYKQIYRANFVDGPFRITLNQNHEGFLELLQNQVRRGQDPSTNRFDPKNPTGEIELRNLRTNLANGSVFTVEVIGPDGRVVAGSLVKREGNILSPDTVIYDPSPVITYDKLYIERGQSVLRPKNVSPINLAKVAVMATLQVAREMGLDALDASMVTHFTAALGGEYIPRDEYLKWIEARNGEAPADVPTNELTLPAP